MRTSVLYLPFIISLLFSCKASGNSMQTDSSYLFPNLSPEEEAAYNAVYESEDTVEYIFKESWTWEYENEWEEDDEYGRKGQITIFYLPEKNYWLFTGEAYGTRGEMIDWVLGKPGGEYIICSTDEFGDKDYERRFVTIREETELSKYFKPEDGQKIFGNKEFGFPLITGKKYKYDYDVPDEWTDFYLGIVKGVDFYSLYHYNNLDLEARMPYSFTRDLPGNTIILSDVSHIEGREVRANFKDRSYTLYYIYLPKEFK